MANMLHASLNIILIINYYILKNVINIINKLIRRIIYHKWANNIITIQILLI